MELKILLRVILLVNLSRSRDLFDTEEARNEWQLLSSDSGEREVAPPQYMLHMYEKYARLEERGHASRTPVIRSILPCNDVEGDPLSVDFCHRKEQGNILKAELHVKTRRLKGRGILNALIEVEREEESSVLAVAVNSKMRAGWRKFDVSGEMREAGKEDWRMRLKFQESSEDGRSEVKLLKPRRVIKLSEKPFIVIFYENEESSDTESDNQHSRRKRSADQRNFYAHEKLNEIEMEIVTMDKENKQGEDIGIDEEDELILDYESDDLSEAEADSHRFNVSSQQNLIPYPRRWNERSRKRKENHPRRLSRLSGGREKRRRGNKTRSQRERGERDRWNSLPRIWKSLGRELGPGQSLSKTPSSMCSLKSLEVNLKEVGWGRTVISPLSYQANYCSGSCSFPLSLAENPTNHATVLTILARKAGLDLPAACCVPKKMDSLTILYFDTDGSVVLKTFPQMSVKSCGCR